MSPKPLLAIKAENIVFSTATQAEFLKSRLDSEPAPATTMIKKYLAVRSQPLTHNFRWKDKSRRVADWPIYVNNFGHGEDLVFIYIVWFQLRIDSSSAAELQTGKKSRLPLCTGDALARRFMFAKN